MFEAISVTNLKLLQLASAGNYSVSETTTSPDYILDLPPGMSG
jgi:hypothetical protein